MTELQSLFTAFGEMLKTVLPKSPFAGIQLGSVPAMGLGWLNWFFPVGACLRIFAAWLVAYGVYLVYSIILRWIKAVE